MSEHPYKQYENTPIWRVIDAAIDDLVANGDLLEKTSRSHIVGFLAKQVIERQRKAVEKVRQSSRNMTRDLELAISELDEPVESGGR